MPKAAFIYADQLSRHLLRSDHPLQPRRLRMTHELLDALGAFHQPDALRLDPRPATVEELLLVHEREYIDAVRSISGGENVYPSARYGFSAAGDNPPFKGMYEAALLSTGASMLAADLVADGRSPNAFNISGGLHHAMANRASGFCTFNDPAIAIAALVAKGMRVAYVDIDAHHGDGVQHAFYSTDRVLTISLHESGKYLFPGTGDPDELGTGAGRGYSVNVPFLPYTSDAVYLEAFDSVVPPLVSAFAPDVLVIQLGVDAHYLDPLSHLRLTTSAYQSAVQRLLGLCPRVVAMGGGGYHLSTVARVWAMEYGQMLGVEWPDTLPEAFSAQYGVTELMDAPQAVEPDVESQTRAFAARSVADVRNAIFPLYRL